MKKIFPEFYPPSEDLEAHWKSCTFVLDANILLAPYRLPKEGREDLLKMLEALKGRLWVPYQAALEYQRNKLTVISEQKNAVSEVLKHIDKIAGEFEKGLLNHRLIKPEALIREVQDVLDRYKKGFLSIQAEQPDVHQPDEIGDRIDAVIGDSIGAAMDQSEIDAINKEGDFRYTHEVAPGFKDAKKTGAYFHQSIKYQAKYGDLYLWKQALKYIKDKDLKFLTFVTGDQKEDWWLRIGGKTIGAPPNLRDEAHQNGASHFHMYSLPQFLEYGKNHLKGAISSAAIEQANELNAVSSFRGLYNPFGLNVRTANSLLAVNAPEEIKEYFEKVKSVRLSTYRTGSGFTVVFPLDVPNSLISEARNYAAKLLGVRSADIINIVGMIPSEEEAAEKIIVVLNSMSTEHTTAEIYALASEHFGKFSLEDQNDILVLTFPEAVPRSSAGRFASLAVRTKGVIEVEFE